MNFFSHSLGTLRNAIFSGAAPCAAAAIGVGDQKPITAVFGNAAIFPDTVPANVDTRFDLASMTKIVSTTMIALKFMEGKMLTSDSTIGEFLDCPRERADITIQQLMTHTAGFVPFLNLSKLSPSPDRALHTILFSKPVCNPGEQVFYSCMGYIVLGAILEKIGRLPLNQLADQLVFDPLHMTHTGYRPGGSNFAATEKWEDTYLCGIVHDENARYLGGISGNAGVFSDLQDMALFASMLSCRGYASGRQYLKPETIDTATRCYTEGMDQRRGLGFHLASPGSFHGEFATSRCYGHTGFTGTSMIIEPDTGLYVVLLSNRVHPTRENVLFQTVRRDFHTNVLKEFSEEGDFKMTAQRLTEKGPTGKSQKIQPAVPAESVKTDMTEEDIRCIADRAVHILRTNRRRHPDTAIRMAWKTVAVQKLKKLNAEADCILSDIPDVNRILSLVLQLLQDRQDAEK